MYTCVIHFLLAVRMGFVMPVNRGYLNSRCRCYALSWLSAIFVSRILSAGHCDDAAFSGMISGESVELLALLPSDLEKELLVAAHQQRDAYDRIESWRGDFSLLTIFTLPEIEISANEPSLDPERGADRKTVPAPLKKKVQRLVGPIQCDRKEKGTFLWDKAGRRLISFFESENSNQCVQIGKAGTYIAETKPVVVNTLVTPEGVYLFHPQDLFSEFAGFERSTTLEMPKSRVVYLSAIDSFSQVRSQSVTLDPSCSLEIGGKRVDEWVSGAVELVRGMIDGVGGYEGAVKGCIDKNRGRLVLAVRRHRSGAPEKVSWTRIVFDIQRSHLPLVLERVNEDGKLYHRMVWDYRQNEGGGFVPSRFADTTFNDGVINSSRQVEYLNSNINSIIEDGDFDLVTLGVENGDRILDQVQNELFVFKNGELTPVPHGNPNKELQRRGRAFWMVGVNVIVVCLVVLTVLKSRRR